MGLGERWPEIARTYADVNLAFGDIVKVTPSSKVVGDLAIFLVSHEMTVAEFEKLGPDHQLSDSELGGGYVHGVAGHAGRRWPAQIQKIVLRGKPPRKGVRARCWRRSIWRKAARRWRRRSGPRAAAR